MEDAQKVQVDILNQVVCLRIAPSKIHGVGLFAMRDIPKGTKLFLDKFYEIYDLKLEHFDKLLPEVRELILERWPQVISGSKFMYPDARLQAYCNHSDTPNYDPHTDLAMKNIKKGEEVTEDYKQIPGWEIAHPWLMV